MVKKKRQSMTLKSLLGIIVCVTALLFMSIEFITTAKPRSLAVNLQNATILAPAISIAPLLTDQLDATAFNYTPFLQGKSGIMYISTEMCAQTCLETVSKMLTVKAKIASRRPTYIIFVSLANFKNHNPLLTDLLQKQFPTIWYIDANDNALQSFFNKLPAGTQTLHTNELYIINKEMQAVAAYNPSISTQILTQEFSTYLH